jgi:SHS2 domain-containing protein
VAWLSELLYLREVNGEAYHRFTVHFPAPGCLTAQAEGGQWRQFDRPIKAVTFHNLTITRRDGRYETTIVFDV